MTNGKFERWFKTLKGECIRVKTPLSLEDARRLVAEFVNHYNTVRLHSAIAYITPADKLAGPPYKSAAISFWYCVIPPVTAR